MDIDTLIKRLYQYNEDWEEGRTQNFFEVFLDCKAAATALSTLQAENEKLRAEFERVKRLYESEKEDFIDFACSGVPNLSPYCLNRHQDCVDERGWCRAEKCRGFSRERDSQKED